jgi:nucleolar complex protein 2
MKIKNKKLEEMSVESFFENIDNFAETDASEASAEQNGGTKKAKKSSKKEKKQSSDVVSEEKPKKKKNKKDPAVKNGIGQESKKKKTKKDAVDETDGVGEGKVKKKKKKKNDEKSLKKSLKNLDKIDPELHKFLQQNDRKLMSFGIDEEEEEVTANHNESSDDEEVAHKPGDLEVASDESDFEEEEIQEKKRKNNSVTLEMLREWQKNLQSDDVPVEVIRNVIKAFNSALLSISSEANMQGEFRVEGSSIFNGIIQLCVLYLEKAIKNYLKLGKKANFKDIQKCKRFSKLKSSLRCYLTDLTKLLENVASTNILSVVLKHLHQIASILTAFTSITKPILKRLIQIWSTGEESVRIVAFLCILKITMNHKELFLNLVLKTMYMEYVKNSKFVSPNTLPAINFMRRSLTELFLLDLNVAYRHVFLFIRQLAIHLRNAIILQKKEHFQQIYNWQFVNSLKLWGDVLSTVSKNVSPAQANKADSKSKLQVCD